jgi:hypothetical protein
VGLVARYLEEQGLSTIVLTPTPEFNREVGFPRIAAIEYPYGRPVGEVGDVKGQKAVLQETLTILENAKTPGQVVDLAFDWPEDPAKVKWHPPEISPIVKLFLDEIKKAGSDKRK